MNKLASLTSLFITLLLLLTSDFGVWAQTIRSTVEPSPTQVELKPVNDFLQNKRVISDTVVSTSKLSDGTVVEERKIVAQSGSKPPETFCLKCFKRPDGSVVCSSIQCLTANPK